MGGDFKTNGKESGNVAKIFLNLPKAAVSKPQRKNKTPGIAFTSKLGDKVTITTLQRQVLSTDRLGEVVSAGEEERNLGLSLTTLTRGAPPNSNSDQWKAKQTYLKRAVETR